MSINIEIRRKTRQDEAIERAEHEKKVRFEERARYLCLAQDNPERFEGMTGINPLPEDPPTPHDHQGSYVLAYMRPPTDNGAIQVLIGWRHRISGKFNVTMQEKVQTTERPGILGRMARPAELLELSEVVNHLFTERGLLDLRREFLQSASDTLLNDAAYDNFYKRGEINAAEYKSVAAQISKLI